MVDDLFSSSHPLLPPKTEDDQLDWLRLLRSRRVGISTFYRLLAEHGTAQTRWSICQILPNRAGWLAIEPVRKKML